MLDREHQRRQHTAPQRRRQRVHGHGHPSQRTLGEMSGERTRRHPGGGETRDRDIRRRRTRSRHHRHAHEPRRYRAEQSRPSRGRVQGEVDRGVHFEAGDRNGRGLCGRHTEPSSSASSQTAAAIVNGAVARRISSPRYRSMSSIGTAARPNATTAEPSATARTSVAASEFCCRASDHAATDAATTTKAPPATAR